MSKLYIIPGDYVYSLMQEILYTIDNEYKEDEHHFWQDEYWNYQISEKLYNEIKKIDITPFIKGFDNNEKYCEFVTKNKEDILDEFEDNNSEDIYNDFNISQYDITPVQFYKALYKDGDNVPYKALHTIGKIVVKRILKRVIYLIENPEKYL